MGQRSDKWGGNLKKDDATSNALVSDLLVLVREVQSGRVAACQIFERLARKAAVNGIPAEVQLRRGEGRAGFMGWQTCALRVRPVHRFVFTLGAHLGVGFLQQQGPKLWMGPWRGVLRPGIAPTRSRSRTQKVCWMTFETSCAGCGGGGMSSHIKSIWSSPPSHHQERTRNKTGEKGHMLTVDCILAAV